MLSIWALNGPVKRGIFLSWALSVIETIWSIDAFCETRFDVPLHDTYFMNSTQISIRAARANVQGRSHRKIWRLNSQRTNAVFHRTVNWSAEFRFGIIRISENQTHPIAVRSKTLKFTFVCGCTFVGCSREDVFQIKRMHVYRMYICVYRENN